MDGLKESLQWLATLAEERDLSEEQVEVAQVHVRRKCEDREDSLPKRVAREAVEEVA